uniref:Uncharacterized protein n=1 Tax=Megaselia scalaris TaxID=36166 RepID=T1H576_MEGSC
MELKMYTDDRKFFRVFPVPGGPNNRIPFGGRLSPLKMSGRRRGQTTASLMTVLANSNPAISDQSVQDFRI